MNVSDDDGDSTGSYDFYFLNSSDMWQEINTGVSDGGIYTTTTWDTAGGTSDLDGDYEVNVTNGTVSETTTVTIDNDDPTASNFEPSDDSYISEDNPTVSFNADGTGSDIEYQKIEVRNAGNDDIEADSESDSVEADLSEGEYYVNYYLKDEAGNWNNETDTDEWTFTVDTSFDVADPDLDWKAIENGDVVKMADDVSLVLNFDDDDEEPSSVTCYDGDADNSDNEVDGAQDIDDSDNLFKFECEFDEDDYDGGDTIDLQLRVEDRAGNTRTYDEDDYTFDKEEPEISDLSTAVGTVTEDFEVEFDAEDDTGIEEMEYFYDDEDIDFGDGNNVAHDEDSFTAEVEDLESGEHTIYVRARDSVESWSDVESLDFNYLPDASERIEVNVPSNLEVTAGQSVELTAEITNTGRIMIAETNVSMSGLASDAETVTGLMPDDTIEVTFDVSATESDIGNKQVTVTTSRPSTSNQVSVRVNANANQQSRIESTLSEYETKLEDLESKVTELQSKGISEDLSERLDSNFTAFQSKVQNARTQVQNGQYFQAQSTLENIDSDYSSADQSYHNVEQIRQNNQRNMMIIMGVGLLLLIGIGGSGVYVYTSDVTPQGFEHKLGLDNLKEKLKKMTESEPEAEEFEWDGFR